MSSRRSKAPHLSSHLISSHLISSHLISSFHPRISTMAAYNAGYSAQDASFQGGGGFKDGKPTTFDGRRVRKAVIRKTIDYASSTMRYLQDRIYYSNLPTNNYLTMQPNSDYAKDLNGVLHTVDNPSHAYCTKYIAQSTNKTRCPITCLAYTPDARRLITASATGEFTLWNGLTFNFESILQSHDFPIRSLTWANNDLFLVSGDDGGIIKYWQTSMNNLRAFKAHKDSIRELSFSPNSNKLASASDDQTVSIWDFELCKEERTLRGHGHDVKSAQWHPQQSLILSGSKDQLIKLWDPRNGLNINTLLGHKNTVNKVCWHQNGVNFISGSRDQLIKVWDLRMLRETQTLKAHKREVTALQWHPFIEQLFVSGAHDGDIRYWTMGSVNSFIAIIDKLLSQFSAPRNFTCFLRGLSLSYCTTAPTNAPTFLLFSFVAVQV
jgi:polyadenylation factor subunit 2